MKECRYKKSFIGFGGTNDALCPYQFPECLSKVEVCYYYDKLQELRIDSRSVEAEWRKERGGKE